MTETAIKVNKLSKSYLIGHKQESDFRYAFGKRLKKIFHSHSIEKELFWALKDINFEIKKGEAVGIIGRNGAGKSTLLKILSRITDPSEGRFEIHGRVSSLLEVGTGFHAELSGRENIYLNGTILGMKRNEIKSKFEEIVDFSGVEKFLDTPVKHYSSGMKVRLAFSVAAHLEPEILIVDEVLAVGDADFQKKCLGKMNQVSKNEGRTVIFVSHNMGAVQNLCSNGILLSKGGMEYIGDIKTAIGTYLGNSESNSEKTWLNKTDGLQFIECSIIRNDVKVNELIAGESYEFRLSLDSKFQYEGVRVRLQFIDRSGNIRFLCNNMFSTELFTFINGSNFVRCVIPKFPLPKETYHLMITIADKNETICELVLNSFFTVVADNFFKTGKEQISREGVLVDHKFYHERK